MKKIILIVTLISLTCSAYAKEKPKWGVKAGLNIASENVDDASTNARAGIHIGGTMQAFVANRVDFQLELLYSMQGGKYSPNNRNTTITDKIDYINVPLLFKFYVDKNRRWSIDAGPQLGYMVSAKYSNGSTTTNFYDNSNLNKFDASFAGGFSFKINDNFDIGVRFVAGMTKILSTTDHKNSVVQMGAGYRF